MAFSWIKAKRTVFFILLICTFISFAGCDPYYDKYPADIADTWYCEAVNFKLTYSENAQGVHISEASLSWGGETLFVNVNFLANQYEVSPKNSNHYEDRYFNGTWKYRKENLVFVIEEDFLFDNRFTELIFVKVED